MTKQPGPLDPKGIRTYSIEERQSKINIDDFARPWQTGGTYSSFLDNLPDILAARDLREVARKIVRARGDDRPVIMALGSHVIKVGLSPVIIDLLKRGIITGLAMNGSGAIHDFEVALTGGTSEDVAESLEDGSFGMAAQTAETLNKAISRCASEDLGIGRTVGEQILNGEYKYKELSILAEAASLSIPATVHVAVGTDIIHMHHSADGAALGRGAMYDFRLFAGMVSELEGGVYLNIGSAVVLPEVFLKAVSLTRNLGHCVRDFTAVNMDFIRHYRPETNVVGRPVQHSGKGYTLIGHHEIMVPLLFAAVIEEWPS